jgi:glycosyltransferase involved in cell wall biosynthesis
MMLALAEEFLGQGVDTGIVLMQKEGVLSENVPPQARVFDLQAQRAAVGPLALARYLRYRCPPVLLSAGYTNRIALLARTLAVVPTSIVISERNNLTASSSNSRLPDWILNRLSGWVYPLADQVIAVSQGVAEDVSQTLGLKESVEVVYNPVVGPQMLELAEKPVEHSWFLDASIPVILGAGRLVEQKDFSTLLRAFAKVRKTRQARLVILGEGEKRPILEHQARQLGIRDHVWMPGFVSNPMKYMADASVFVLSSRWEGLGNVLIEAMACGVPVVSTDCPSGPAEILEDGSYGRLVPVEDPSELAEGIEAALDGHVDPAPLSALDRFRRDRVAEQYLDILGSVA